MKKGSSIPKSKEKAVLSCYADTKNYNAVARQFGYSSYAIRKKWGELSPQAQASYIEESEVRKKQTTQKYVDENSQKIAAHLDLALKIRNTLLDKLAASVDAIVGKKAGHIILLKEAANTLKTITSIPIDTANGSRDDQLTVFIEELKKQSTIQN